MEEYQAVKQEKFDECTARNEKIYLWRQVTLAFIFDAMSAGILGGYTATLLPELEASMGLTKSELSWVASAAVLPTAPSCILGGWLLEKCGRKRSFFLATLLSSLGWGCIACAYNFYAMVTGRFITGIACGLAATIAPIYVGEVTRPTYRGLFLSCAPFGLAIGPLFSHILSLFMDWRQSAIAFTVATFLPLLLLANLSESHIWYLQKQRIDDATRAFYWFRGHSEASKSELDKIISDKIEQNERQKYNLTELWRELASKRFLKPLLVTNILFATLQWSGIKTVLFFSIDILKDVIPDLDELLATIILDIIRILTAFLACIIVKRYFVRSLAMFSGIGASISLIALSIFIYLSQTRSDNLIYQILALIALLCYLTFISLGLMPLPWVVYGELFPPSTKGFGSALSVIMYFSMFFIIIKISPDLVGSYGTAGMFAIFAGCTGIGTTLLYFILPETKNKTLKEIEEFFLGKNKI